jgi:SNF2 family DNA or RNA helicase
MSLFVLGNINQPGTQFKPWQVTGTSWMLQQEQTPVAGGILADACGMG